MPPIDTSALAAIFAWVWDQYGKDITSKSARAVWERLRWEDRAFAYAEKVRRLYGTMQILGQPRPVPLEGIYTAISLLDKPTAWQRYTLEEMEAEFTIRPSRYFHVSDEEKRRDGLEMVRGGENLFILGKPGAGKTTFLKHVALQAVAGRLGRVPIFVGLKQLSDSGLSVFDFVVNEFDVCGFPDAAGYLDRLLKSGRAILLFDGLDEVNVAEDERAHLITDVEGFTRKYDRCQRLITCRLAAEGYGFRGYTYVEMADFDKDQIREYVARWFSGTSEKRKRRDLFLRELEKPETEGLLELCRVPLLLALLCLAFEDTLRLSQQRADLYQDALNALLKKWDTERNIQRDEAYHGLSPKRKEQMLANIAAETFDRGEYFIPLRTLAHSFEKFLACIPNAPEEIDGEVVLNAIIAQHGLFLERAHNIYSFAHLTFQEYFTARYVVENEARGTLPHLIGHFADRRYREVFLLTAYQLVDTGKFFSLFADLMEAEVREHLALTELLRRAARKAALASDKDTSNVAERSAYLLLFISLALAPARSRARALARALTRIRDLIRDYAPNPELYRALIQTPKLALSLEFDRATTLENARSLTRSLHPALARDIALTNAWLLFIQDRSARSPTRLAVAGSFLATASGLSDTVGDIDVRRELESLVQRMRSTPDTSWKPEQLEQLAGDLRIIMNSRCGLMFPDLPGDDWESLSRYLEGTRLILDCLSQALVSDRAAIEDRLLLLPEE